MSISPKKKISKRQERTRHSTWERLTLKKLSAKYNMTTCKNCGAKKLSHRVCPSCGFYAGKQVLTIKSKSKYTVVDA